MPVDVVALAYASGLAVERDVPLGPYTSLKIGGPARYFVRTRGPRDLARCLSAAHQHGLPVLLLGGGSNMLIADRGFSGLAIKVESERRHRAEVLSEDAEGVHLRCDAGVLLAGLSRWTASLGWNGLEWACGIPGTAGGAAAGNAGAYGSDIAASLVRALVWTPDGEHMLTASEMAYGYRTSRFKHASDARTAGNAGSAGNVGTTGAILEVELHLVRGDASESLARIAANESARREKQPSERSCGSVFKNPPGDASGRLIDAAGLKGTIAGRMQISTRHGNFFVNRGEGCAADVLALVRLARRRVHEVFGVTLAIEIILAGDWPRGEVDDL